MATKPPELINRSAINVDQATNRSALATIMAAIAGAGAAVQHGTPIWEWLPIATGLFLSAFSQYLQGAPSREMRLVQRLIDADGGATNADVIGGIADRVLGRHGDRPLDNSESYYDVDRPSASPRRGNAVDAPDVRDRHHRPTVNLGNVSVPEWSQSPEEIRRAAYREVDRLRGNQPIDGTNIGPAEFGAMSRSGSESEDGPRSEAW